MSTISNRLRATAQLLMEAHAYTVAVKHSDSSRLYTYLVPDDIKLAKMDAVVVYNANGWKCAEVVEVHNHLNIDPDSNVQYRWVVQRIDTERHARLMRDEERIAEALRVKQQNFRRQQALQALGLDGDTNLKQLLLDK